MAPIYEVLAAAIRSIDPNHIIFYEPVTWGVFNEQFLSGTGFLQVPGGSAYQSLSIMSYHYYCWILTPADEEIPYPHWKYLLCDVGALSIIFSSVLGSRQRTGGGLFLTEFGLCYPDNMLNDTTTVECRQVLQHADRYIQSWMYWDPIFYYPNGSLSVGVVRDFSRVYPRAVAGVIRQISFDPDSSNATIRYEYGPTIRLPTEIFIPERVHYPNGFEVKIVPPSVKYSYNPGNQVLTIWPIWAMRLHLSFNYWRFLKNFLNRDFSTNMEVTVFIRPKRASYEHNNIL